MKSYVADNLKEMRIKNDQFHLENEEESLMFLDGLLKTFLA